MQLDKRLKIEGFVITICIVLIVVGLLLRYSGISGIFNIIVLSPLFVIAVFALLLYWIYRVVKSKK